MKSWELWKAGVPKKRPERPGASRASTVVNRAEPILPSWMAACGRFLVKTKKGPLCFRNQKSVLLSFKTTVLHFNLSFIHTKKKKKEYHHNHVYLARKFKLLNSLRPSFFFRVQEKLPTCLANLSKCSINNCYDFLAIFFFKKCIFRLESLKI